MVSGALAQFLSSPTDIIKVRMQLEHGRRRAGLPPLYGCVSIVFLVSIRYIDRWCQCRSTRPPPAPFTLLSSQIQMNHHHNQEHVAGLPVRGAGGRHPRAVEGVGAQLPAGGAGAVGGPNDVRPRQARTYATVGERSTIFLPACCFVSVVPLNPNHPMSHQPTSASFAATGASGTTP